MRLDPTLPKETALHRRMRESDRKTREYAKRFKEEELKRKAEALKLVESLLPDYEEKPL